MKRHFLAAILTAALAFPTLAQEHLNVYGGGWDIFKDAEDGSMNNIDGLVGVEYRGNYLWKGLRPDVGGFVTSKASVYGYAGIGYDIFLNTGHNFVVTPNFAVGAFGHGDGKDLGGVLEFKSGLEADYQWPDQQRLGVAIAHISNAYIYDKNPGTELLTLQYSYPISLFGN